jgi:hypothetical protein
MANQQCKVPTTNEIALTLTHMGLRRGDGVERRKSLKSTALGPDPGPSPAFRGVATGVRRNDEEKTRHGEFFFLSSLWIFPPRMPSRRLPSIPALSSSFK